MDKIKIICVSVLSVLIVFLGVSVVEVVVGFLKLRLCGIVVVLCDNVDIMFIGGLMEINMKFVFEFDIIYYVIKYFVFEFIVVIVKYDVEVVWMLIGIVDFGFVCYILFMLIF